MKKLISRSASVPANGQQGRSIRLRRRHNQPLDSSPVYLEAQRVGFALIEIAGNRHGGTPVED